MRKSKKLVEVCFQDGTAISERLLSNSLASSSGKAYSKLLAKCFDSFVIKTDCIDSVSIDCNLEESRSSSGSFLLIKDFGEAYSQVVGQSGILDFGSAFTIM